MPLPLSEEGGGQNKVVAGYESDGFFCSLKMLVQGKCGLTKWVVSVQGGCPREGALHAAFVTLL